MKKDDELLFAFHCVFLVCLEENIQASNASERWLGGCCSHCGVDNAFESTKNSFKLRDEMKKWGIDLLDEDLNYFQLK